MKLFLKISTFSLVAFLLLFSYFYKNTIFQEWNPYYVWIWIIKLFFWADDFVCFSDEKYIFYSNNWDDLMKQFMFSKWFVFKEQLWSGYIFYDVYGHTEVVTWRMFTSYFKVYYINI